MPPSWDALFILVVLLPGFMCSRIVDGIFVRQTQTGVGRITEACLYSFLIYIAFAITLKLDKLNQVQPKHLLILAGYSLVLGLLVGGALHHDVPTRLLRFVHLTQKTTNYSVWNDTFRHYGGYIQIDGPGILLTADSGIETILFLRCEGQPEVDKPEKAKAQSAT